MTFFIMTIAACGSSSDSLVSNLSGAITIDGSSTVYPITEAVAEEFQIANPDTRVTVGVSGTGGGFTKFCVGDTDISGASRPIKDNERALCAENGVEFVELRVGLDGLAVVKNKDNNYLNDLSMDQLAKVWGPTSEDSVMEWSQVDSSFPAEDIDLYGPGTDSGTFDFFTEEVNGEGGASRGDYTPSEDDNVLVTGIAGNKHSMGYFGYAYYEENMDKLGIVRVNGVTPSNETVSNGSYALSRPLYIYVSINSLQKKEQVLEFVRYYVSDEGIAMVIEVGYSNVPADELEASRRAVEESVQ
ncbi:MAG: PstS family phosphate ABC transporter substrate-binding protein [Chloroflexota bacterium]|nr:PstS family phosphate ABC transporter substrate-binding protein [Chloroflexota bacterium]